MNTVKALLRGLRALDMVRASAEPVRATDVAARLEMDKGSASRTLHTLAEAGYVEQTHDRRYVPGKKLRSGHPTQLIGIADLREHASSLLADLVELSHECAHLAVLAGDRVLYVDAVQSQQSLRVDHPIGTLAPLHCTALGKVFLAFVGAPIPEQLERMTQRTVTDRQLLAAHLRTMVALGYTTDDEEYALGVRCVASPLRDESGRVIAAIGVSGAAARISLDRLPELGAEVQRVAARYGQLAEGSAAARGLSSS